ncbi:MAG: N-glycosylase/DNA lyase [Candidatus Omnitrophica bacterium]|nr:N-glycosylase/DNA lyase [Candidatus Omnitrophota bacterium]
MRDLLLEYRKKRKEIKDRLAEFRRTQRAGDKDIFSELCFCLLTPQSKAVSCDRALRNLRKSGLLFSGCARAIKKVLKGSARFHNKKAEYLIGARRIFTNSRGLKVKDKLASGDTLRTREWLVSNIKGLGYKEASHFLRNIGRGKDLAILDVHILRNLKRYGIIDEIPASLSRKKYLDIEDRMRWFSRKSGIPLEELDLLFWSKNTGYVFK